MSLLDKTSGASQIFRGISRAQYAPKKDEKVDTSIMDLAHDKAETIKDKSGITVALEDFTAKFKDFHDVNRSNISQKDAKRGFFETLGSFFGIRKDNIFEKDAAQDYLKNENIYQSDIFEQELSKSDGIRYAKEGDNYATSALNFAKADIKAIEKPFTMSTRDVTDDNKLDYADINSYINFEGDLSENIQEMDLGKSKKKLTPKEYASYILATDGIDGTKQDGAISKAEYKAASEKTNSDLKEKAQEYYKKYYK